MTKFHLTEEDCNKQVTGDHVYQLTRIHGGDWRLLAPYLDISHDIAADVDLNFSSDEQKKYLLLQKWRLQKGRDATYKALMDVYISCELGWEAEQLCIMMGHQPSYRDPTTTGKHSK